jgi:hypothetical protein
MDISLLHIAPALTLKLSLGAEGPECEADGPLAWREEVKDA